MDVKDRTITEGLHSIEWGDATWTKDRPDDEKEKSIRNRYDRDGGFNYAGSSEVPWSDFNKMIIESIKRNHFSKEELDNIMNEIKKKNP
jgi:hypothetical protein